MLGIIDRADIRPILNVFLILFLGEIPFFFEFSFLEWVAWIAFFSTCMSPLAVIIHNHEHHQVFRNFQIDRMFALVRALAFGISPLLGRINHNLNHHGNSGMLEDWCRPSQAGEYSMGRYWRYVSNTFAEYWKFSFAEGNPKLEPKLLYWLKVELCVTLAWALGHFVWSPQVFLFAFVVPRLISYFNIILVNLFQHEGCDPKSKWNHSRNFVGASINFFLYNNGYHTVHHNFPSVHWSKLPSLHREHSSKIDPSLIENSLTGFILKDLWRVAKKSFSKKVEAIGNVP